MNLGYWARKSTCQLGAGGVPGGAVVRRDALADHPPQPPPPPGGEPPECEVTPFILHGVISTDCDVTAVILHGIVSLKCEVASVILYGVVSPECDVTPVPRRLTNSGTFCTRMGTRFVPGRPGISSQSRDALADHPPQPPPPPGGQRPTAPD